MPYWVQVLAWAWYTPNDTEKPATQPSTSTSVKTGDSTMIAPFVIVASLSLFALVTVIKKSKAIR